MVVLKLNKHKYYSHQDLLDLGLTESKLPYNNYKVYKRKSVFYLFKFTNADRLIFDSINY